MAIGKAEGIGTSYNGDQTFLFQLSLKIIDENQRGMLSDLRKQNFPSNAIFFFVEFWIQVLKSFVGINWLTVLLFTFEIFYCT